MPLGMVHSFPCRQRAATPSPPSRSPIYSSSSSSKGIQEFLPIPPTVISKTGSRTMQPVRLVPHEGPVTKVPHEGPVWPPIYSFHRRQFTPSSSLPHCLYLVRHYSSPGGLAPPPRAPPSLPPSTDQHTAAPPPCRSAHTTGAFPLMGPDK